MKKIGIILITTVLGACTEQELPAPVTPITPDGQALIVPSATVVTMEGTSDVMPRYKAAEATMPGTRGTTRATTYPYTTSNASGQQTVIVYADDNGKATDVALHAPWLVTPEHNELSPINSVSPRFELGDQCNEANTGLAPTVNNEYYWSDAITLCSKYFKNANKSDLGTWRLPTLKEAKHLSSSLSYWVWTATRDSNDPNKTYVYRSYEFSNANTDDCFVRCVRDAYPYITTNADSKASVIVSQDAYGGSFDLKHAPWQKTPYHNEKAPENSVSPRFEVAQSDAPNPSNTTPSFMSWYLASGTEYNSDPIGNTDIDVLNPAPAKSACTDGWRLPTIKELQLIHAQKAQLDVTGLKTDFNSYWAMTEESSTPGNGYVIVFDRQPAYDGYIIGDPKQKKASVVRCVRDLTRSLPPRPGPPGNFADGIYPFGITAYAGTVEPDPTANLPTSYIVCSNVLSTATGFEMQAPKYYPADGTQKLYFYASAPSHSGGGGTSTSEAHATHKLTDGLKDVMYAKDVRGIAKSSNPAQQQQPSFLFQHVLKQVQFKVKMDDSYEENKKFTKLTLKNVANTASIKLISGTTTFSGTSDIVHTLATPITLTTTAQDACTLMFEPGATFTVEVEAGGVVYSIPVTLTGGTNPGAAGTANVVTITFKRKAVSTTAGIVPWKTETIDSDIDVNE